MIFNISRKILFKIHIHKKNIKSHSFFSRKMQEKEEVRCLACFESWDDATFGVYACGMLLCDPCKWKVVDSKCPNCRGDIRNHILTGIVAKREREIYRMMDVVCDNNECKKVMKAHEITVHKKQDCLIICTNLYCTIKIMANQLEQHKAQECPMQVIKCNECCESVLRQELEIHIQTECIMRVVNCNDCGQDMYANCLDAHVSEMCEETLINCERNCGTKYPRKETAQHDVICANKPCVCPHLGCIQRVARHAMKAHLDVCLHVITECKNCKLVLSKMDLKHHSNICPEKRYTCSGCKMSILAKYKALHILSHCKERWTACKSNKTCMFYQQVHKPHEKHACPQLDFDHIEGYKPGMMLDLRANDKWSTVVVLSTAEQQGVLSCLPMIHKAECSLRKISIAYASVEHVALPFSMTMKLPPKILLPYALLIQCPQWNISQLSTQKERAMLLGTTHEHKYATMGINNNEITYLHNFTTDYECKRAPNDQFFLVECCIMRIFSDYYQVRYQAQDYCLSRSICGRELATLKNSTGLVANNLYSLREQQTSPTFTNVRYLGFQNDVFQFKTIKHMKDLQSTEPDLLIVNQSVLASLSWFNF